MEIAEKNAVIRKALVELHHQRLVLRTDRPDQYWCSGLGLPLSDVLSRVGPNGSRGQSFEGCVCDMKHNPCIQGKKATARRKQWIDIDFLDPGLLDDKPAEANNNSFQGVDVHWSAAPHTFECGENMGLLH